MFKKAKLKLKKLKLNLSIFISLFALAISIMGYLNSAKQTRFTELSAVPIFSLHQSFSEEEGKHGPLTHSLEIHANTESFSGFEVNNVTVLGVSIIDHKGMKATLELIIDDYFNFCQNEWLPDTSLVAVCETENNLEKLFELEDQLRKINVTSDTRNYHVMGNRNYTRIQYSNVLGEEQEVFLGSSLHGQITGEDFQKSYNKAFELNEKANLPIISLSNSVEHTHAILSDVAETILLISK